MKYRIAEVCYKPEGYGEYDTEMWLIHYAVQVKRWFCWITVKEFGVNELWRAEELLELLEEEL